MIETITLTDFRNHTASRIQTHGRHNIIITGPNGAGKTAILEAVSILSGDRGLRGAAMPDMARFGGSGGFSVFAVLNDDTEITDDSQLGDDTTPVSGEENLQEPPAATPTGTNPSVTPMTREQSEKMFAQLEAVFGKVPSGVELNNDGTFNYGRYQNININALKYAVTAQENYANNPEDAVSYNNYVNNDKDRMYIDGRLSITKNQLSNAESYGAFLVRNNPDTYIELGKITDADRKRRRAGYNRRRIYCIP